jgi:hypothetical protein
MFVRMAMAGAVILHIPYDIGVSRRHVHQKTRRQDKLYLPTVRALIDEYRRIIDKASEALETDVTPRVI